MKEGILISNKEIFCELRKLKEDNAAQHEQIILKLEKRNSQINNLKYIVGTTATISLLTLGWFILHLFK